MKKCRKSSLKKRRKNFVHEPGEPNTYGTGSTQTRYGASSQHVECLPSVASDSAYEQEASYSNA